MPSSFTRISCTCALDPSSRSCRSRFMPLVMASAMTSAATPAATPAMEMVVTTRTTACRRLALRYRVARKSSNRIKSALLARLLRLGGDHRLGHTHVVVPVVDADGDQVLGEFASGRVERDAQLIVFAPGVGELADRFDELPRSRVERVFGVSDGRKRILGVEGHPKRLRAGRVRAIGFSFNRLQSADHRRRGVYLEPLALLCAGEGIGGGMRGGGGGPGPDLIAAIGNQRCVETVGLVGDAVF